MRSEPGVSLVSGALQSSLARVQTFHARDNPHNSQSSVERKEKVAATNINKHLSAYCDSVGSNFASYSADQFLALGNTLTFDEGGFLKRSISNDIVNDCVILKQQNNQNGSASSTISKKKKKLISPSTKADLSSVTTASPNPPRLNGVPSTPTKNNRIVKDIHSHVQESPNKKPKKFDNLIQKLLKLLKDKTIGKNKRKRLTKKLRHLEKRKSETTLNSSANAIIAHNLSKSPTKTAVVNGLINPNSTKPKTKMGPENCKNGVVLTNGNGITTNSNNLQLPVPKRVLYPRENIVLGWKNKRNPGAGFLNFGNTCYLNSSLQALFHIPAFVNWIQNDDEHRRICKGTLPNQTACIICVVYTTLQEHSRTNSAIRPRVLDKLKAICKHFSYGRQEDAHEFLRYLFEGMERSYLTLVNGLRLDNRTKETNPLGQIFGGYIRTEVTCLQCNSVSTTFQPSAELQLDIRHSTTLEDALMLHFRREKLDNNDYKCEKCRRISQATKQFSLEQPPLVLCLQLKRFTLYGNKIGKRIHCNKFLNMSRYLHKSRKTTGFFADNELKYRLVALVTHLGQSPNCGHYTAIAEGSNGSYYQFDDQFVHEVSTQTALNNDAYLLIYEMDKSSQPGVTNGGMHSSLSSPNNLLSSKPSTVTSTSGQSIANGGPSPARKFAIPFAKTNGSTPALKTTSMMSNTDAVKTNNGPGSCIDRKIIRFGIPTSSLMKHNTTSPNKINILKPGVALTNSARLYSTPAAGAPSTSKAPVSNCVKLVPYDAMDNDEESDQEAVEELPPKKTNEDTKLIGPVLEVKPKLCSSPLTTKVSKPTSASVGSISIKSNNLETTFGVKRKLEEILGPTSVHSPKKKGTLNATATSDWTITTGYSSDPNDSKKSKAHPAGIARSRSIERDNPNKTSGGVRLPTAVPLIPNNSQSKPSSKIDLPTPTVIPFEGVTKAAKIGATTPLKVAQNGHSHSSPSTKKKRKRSCSNSSDSSSSGEDRKKRKKDGHHKKKKKEKKKDSSSDSDSSSSDRHHKRHKSKKKHSKRDRDEKEKSKGSPQKSSVVVNGHGGKRERDASSVDREQVLRNARNPSRSPSKSTSTTGSINIFSPSKIDCREKTIVDWNGKESLLASAIEKERMSHKEKSRGEYDEELDQGRVKKQRISRSPSRCDNMPQDGNKFQSHQDRKKLVSQWSGIMNGYGPGFKDHASVKSSPKDIKKPWADKKFGNHHPSSNHSNNYDSRQNRNHHNSSYTAEHRNNQPRPYNGYNGNNRYRHDRNQSWRGGGRNRR